MKNRNNSTYATGTRLPRRNPVIATGSVKISRNWPPAARLLYARLEKAGSGGLTLNRLAPSGDRYKRWLVRCLLKAHIVRVAPRRAKVIEMRKAA